MAKRGMKITEALGHLGLTKEAGETDVKQTYKDLAKIWHPDRFQNDEHLAKKAEEQIKVINEAKKVALDYLKKYGHFRFIHDGPDPGTVRQQAYGPRPGSAAGPTARKAEETKEPEDPVTESEPEEAGKWKPDYSSFSDYHPRQNMFIGIILAVVLAVFLFVLFAGGADSRKERVEAYLKKREELKKEGPKTLPPPKVEPVEEDIPEDELAPARPDSFFTVGSSKDWVYLVQGAPYQIKGSEWRYGFSYILFEGNIVSAWESSELNPLNIGMLRDSTWNDSILSFHIGSPKSVVAALQGAPDKFEANRWSYGEAVVEFNADTVIYWKNDIKNTLFAEEIDSSTVSLNP